MPSSGLVVKLGTMGSPTRRHVRRVHFGAVAVLLVALKWAQFRWWPDPGGGRLLPGLTRQVAACAFVWLLVRRATGHVDLGVRSRAASAGALGLVAVGVALQAGTHLTGWSVLNLVCVTAIGEEVLFRGLLPALVACVDQRDAEARFLPALAFGLWHVPDVWSAGVLYGVAVVLATMAAAVFIFEPVRRRTGSIVTSAVLHALINGSGIAVVGW
jgi:membrane protease YdiL (CAAX protease family)